MFYLPYFLWGALFFSWSTLTFGQERLLFLGDSLTEGYGLSKESSYPQVVETLLNKEKANWVKVVNAGEGGSKSQSGLPRLKWLLREKASVLVLALGANDGLQGVRPPQIKENLKKIIDHGLKDGIKILLVGMKMPFNYGKDYQKKFESVFLELHQEYKGKISFTPFLLKGVGGVRELNLPDGIHPNEKGHKIMAETILKDLRPLLEKKE